ncbi:MAG: pilus assembly protein PilP [Desulfocapsaceae bacterium]
MKMIPCRHSLRRRMVSTGILLLVFILTPALFAADAQEDQTATPEETVPIEIEKSTSTFEYQTENRPDPFAPFVTGPARANPIKPDEIVDNDEVLSGMQLFEPGQLTLVALMLTGGSPYAMVQDFTGRGYMIEEGMKIGRRGVITKIAEDRVIIEETAQTRSGKILTNEIAMVLKKEGEE